MQEIPEHIEQIIAKQLDGSLSDKEQKSLEEWLSKSDENLLLYKKTKSIWLSAQAIDVDAAWKKVSAQIEEAESSGSNTAKVISLRPWLSRAAVILAICLFSFAIYLLFNQPNEELIAVKAETEVYELALPDSSFVSLNQGASLEYPKEFEAKERKVKLKGEAFFEVEHAAERPFIIDAQEIDVEVLGTSFFVNSPENAQQIEVGVKSGSVSVTSKKTSEKHILSKGDKLIYLVDGSVFKIEKMKRNELFWQDSALLYNQVSLPEVFKDLELQFKVDITYQLNDFANCSFSGRFNTNDLEEILEQISLSYGFTYERASDGYELTGKPKCRE